MLYAALSNQPGAFLIYAYSFSKTVNHLLFPRFLGQYKMKYINSSQASSLARTSTHFKKRFDRLRRTRSATFIFYSIGLIIYFACAIPLSIKGFIDNGIIEVWYLLIYTYMPIIIIAANNFIFIQTSLESPGDIIAQPKLFLRLMIFSTLSGYACTWIYDTIFCLTLFAWFREQNMIPNYFIVGIYLVPFSWLACLYQLQADNKAKLTAFALNDSLLRRQLAQAQLLSARSRINPELLTRILERLRERYQLDIELGNDLLDKLTNHLRLMIRRERHGSTSISQDLALIESYIQLRQAEVGIVGTLSYTDSLLNITSDKLTVALFSEAQKLFEAAVLDGATNINVHISSINDAITISTQNNHLQHRSIDFIALKNTLTRHA